MIKDANNRMMILLLDGSDADQGLGRWLGDNGFVAWKANDISHAIEELSDFTVRKRPDVVLLEVADLSRRFDGLSSTLHTSSGNVAVCGYSAGHRKTTRPYFASDLDQLRSLIAREIRPPRANISMNA